MPLCSRASRLPLATRQHPARSMPRLLRQVLLIPLLNFLLFFKATPLPWQSSHLLLRSAMQERLQATQRTSLTAAHTHPLWFTQHTSLQMGHGTTRTTAHTLSPGQHPRLKKSHTPRRPRVTVKAEVLRVVPSAQARMGRLVIQPLGALPETKGAQLVDLVLDLRAHTPRRLPITTPRRSLETSKF